MDVSKRVIHLVLVLDKSGSMLSNAEETRRVVNGYMDDIRADNSTACTCTIVQFGYVAYNPSEPMPIANVPQLDCYSYHPEDGATALFDGVGAAIDIAEETANRGDRIVVVVVTDGGDNASHKHSAMTIRQRVAELHREGNRWAFIMLGEDESYKQGIAMGFRKENVVQFNTANPDSVFAALSAATRRMRRAAAAGESYAGATLTAALR